MPLDTLRRPRADRARVGADRRAALRALLPHRARHRRVRALEGHPVPGPRVGRELRRLLRARHHRGRSRAHVDAVRALHQPGAERTSGHRRRLRASAARGSDAVRLREVRPRPRRARRDAHHLSPEERRARRRQGPGPLARRGRPPRRRVRVVGRARDPRRAHPRGGLRSGESADPPPDRAVRRADGLPAPPVAARRRLRDRAGAARAHGAGRERRDGRPHGDPVGQGRPRRDGAPQGRLPRARHALGDPALPRLRGSGGGLGGKSLGTGDRAPRE